MEPESFIETTRSFLRSCLKGRRGEITSDGAITLKSTRYSSDLVKKVVHIFRNPLDNVVARFHLDRKIKARKNPDWLEEYPNNPEGFRLWCAHLNENQKLSSSHWTDSSLLEAMEGVPCVTEFYRYVQWHNLAFATTSDLQIPSFVFHYEDYSTRFEDVTNELTVFLGLEQVGDAPEFIDNKKYGDYYTAKQKHAVAMFIREFASKPTWQNVQHYMSSFMTEPVDVDTLIPIRTADVKGYFSTA